MEILNQTTLVLASHKIESFVLTDECSYHRLVILHRGLWEKGMLLVLSDPWFDLDDGEDSEQVSGFSLDLITCESECYSEWSLMETVVGMTPWDLARSVVEKLSWIDSLDPRHFRQFLDALSVRIQHIKKSPDDKTSVEVEMTSNEERFRYGLTLNSDQPVDKDKNYTYLKSVYNVLMEGASVMLSPINLEF